MDDTALISRLPDVRTVPLGRVTRDAQPQALPLAATAVPVAAFNASL